MNVITDVAMCYFQKKDKKFGNSKNKSYLCSEFIRRSVSIRETRYPKSHRNLLLKPTDYCIQICTQKTN